MATVINSLGTDVSFPAYLSSQVKLAGKFAAKVLGTGPERGMLREDTWDALFQTIEDGTQSMAAVERLQQSAILQYLLHQWTIRFASIFGALAKGDRQPLEVVEAQVEAFQHSVVEHIGNLRYHWACCTKQNLALQTAIEQVRWNGPELKLHCESRNWGTLCDPFLCADALFPYVVETARGCYDLLFDSEHIAVQTLRASVQTTHIGEIQKSLAK